MNKLAKCEFPENENSLDKIDFEIEPFMEIGWYYKEDIDFYEENKEYHRNPIEDPPHTGIIIPKNDIETNRGLDIDEVNVIVTNYPTEKCNPNYIYATLSDLLDSDIISIINLTTKNK